MAEICQSDWSAAAAGLDPDGEATHAAATIAGADVPRADQVAASRQRVWGTATVKTSGMPGITCGVPSSSSTKQTAPYDPGERFICAKTARCGDMAPAPATSWDDHPFYDVPRASTVARAASGSPPNSTANSPPIAVSICSAVAPSGTGKIAISWSMAPVLVTFQSRRPVGI